MWEMKWPEERARNEHKAISLIREKTDIPVPKVLETGYNDEYGHYLKMEWADGIDLSEVVEVKGAGAACLMTPGQDQHANLGKCERCRTIAMANADAFVHDVVYPALERLRSDQTGLDGTVIPPHWIAEGDAREDWPAKKSDAISGGSSQPFVFCHGDLVYHNLLIDPITLEVKYLVDWECAGFFPEEFLHIFSRTRADFCSWFEDRERRQRLIDLLL